MFKVRLEGFKELQDMLATTGRQAPYATMLVLNDLAFEIRRKEIETMQRVFKSPRPETLRRMGVDKAKKENLRATVTFNQSWDWDEYMVAETTGGPRPMKRGEKAFGHYYVPGPGAVLDQYGNISGGQIQQIMSYLGKFKERGWKMNRTRTRQEALGKGMKDYFMLDKPTNGLKAGVYMRVVKGQGQMLYSRAMANKPKGTKKTEFRAKTRAMLERGVIPVLIFLNKPPVYRALFPFHGIANEVVDTNAHRMVKDRVLYVMDRAR